MIHGYLRLVPGVANDPEGMAETTELYDNWLKLELIDHYERMTNKKRMGSEAMRQWLAGAAVHMHMRIHQVRTRDRQGDRRLDYTGYTGGQACAFKYLVEVCECKRFQFHQREVITCINGR